MIEVTHLAKDYGGFSAVRDVSFKLAPGDILGFLGPNGAGKSTTMKMLTGFLRPSAGSVTVWGCDVWSDPLTAQQHIGYLPEGAPAYEEMTVGGFLGFIAEVRGYHGQELIDRVAASVETMSLEDVTTQRIETLSKGFKRRVGLAQAILHDPDVLILDEPTDGLDPNQKHQVREMIKGLSREKIVIVSTHILEEVSAVCNRVIVLSHGGIVADMTPEELLATSRYHGAVSVLVPDADPRDVASSLSGLDGVAEVETRADGITLFPVPGKRDLATHALKACQEQGWQVGSVYMEQGRMDEVFRGLTQGESQ